MKIVMTGRKIRLTSDLKKYVEERAERLAKYGWKSPVVSFTLKAEKYRKIAELHLSYNGFILQAQQETDDLRASVDQVITKIERQIKRRHEKVIHRRLHPVAQGDLSRPLLRARRAATFGQKEEKTPFSIDEKEESALQKPTLERATIAILSCREALSQIEESPKDFLLFRDRSNRQLNLLYKKKSGRIGQVEWMDTEGSCARTV